VWSILWLVFGGKKGWKWAFGAGFVGFRTWRVSMKWFLWSIGLVGTCWGAFVKASSGLWLIMRRECQRSCCILTPSWA
jgi:hypothetical protein